MIVRSLVLLTGTRKHKIALMKISRTRFVANWEKFQKFNRCAVMSYLLRIHQWFGFFPLMVILAH